MTDLRCVCVKTSLVNQLKICLIKDVLVTYPVCKIIYMHLKSLPSGRKSFSSGSRSFNNKNLSLTITIEVKT